MEPGDGYTANVYISKLEGEVEHGRELNRELRDALHRMYEMYFAVLEKVDLKHSFLDAATIKEMNLAPLQAQEVLEKADEVLQAEGEGEASE